VNSLYVASHDSPCAFDKNYLLDLTLRYQSVDSSEPKVGFRKVYISRESALKRKVSNERELIPILEAAGFEIVQMEKFSFKEQRDLMRETKVLMGIHGAGLANLIFLPQDSKVVELHPNVERYNSCFYHLAAALDVDYYYSFEEGDHPNPQEANLRVDLDNILELLKTI
jgi:capsular polysaccharide biosynthesis protein